MTLVYVALDYETHQENIKLADEIALSPAVVDYNNYGFKVNLDAMAHFSPGALNPYTFITQISTLGKPVFVDMKMWNGATRMKRIAQGCAELGVDIVNMYAHAGPEFISRVVDAVSGSETKVFALTVLTHYTEADTHQLYGRSLPDAVHFFAEEAVEGGAHGIILPGNQLDVVSDLNVLKLTPGIRPAWYEDKKANFQKQITTPTDAVLGGADYLVVGSPIIKSPNKGEALQRILEEIAEASQ
tara:strand:+ start:5166 stop:5894 length:729 start_codon:yes stop_codon:yes gene_type:complete